jgi:hypothetical protein
MLDDFTRIRPVTNATDYQRIQTIANNGAVAPTHIVTKSGQCVGYLSVGGLPVVTIYLDPEQVKPRATLSIAAVVDDIMAHRQVPLYGILLHKTSRLLPHVVELGGSNDGSDYQLIYKAP